MYGWLWHHLPGPTAMRMLILFVAVAAIIVVLFGWVFPVIDEMIAFDESGLNSTPETGQPSPSDTGR